ncbi:hypothetical protein NNC19_01435 [Clostridium sp. SHJSY1]|uniref:hypothetical protein n=1 Tax=Clostridium sp. SHJSY1 TaxID=2942483 RepID=UPI0028751285|nr:hypothetical protein [Clostridium sp. SHJSY1]MDS0524321.1 hypothetical protein [Clostridium sp. SHJSY1]
MRNLQLEKSVKKLDREIEALKIAKKYLSNHAEIEEVREFLNRERQALADELYFEDAKSNIEVKNLVSELIGKNLEKEEQKKLLEEIKEIYGRQLPNASKESTGLNAWLNKIEVKFKWIENDDSDWSTLVIESL